jgi:hypothetical protein
VKFAVMASLEDKIRGEKKSNYASSSEDEDEGASRTPTQLPIPSRDGLPQTGPKGVLSDYMRYQEESQRVRIQQEKEKIELINNTAFTVKAHSEEVDGAFGRSGPNADLMEALDQLDSDQNDPFIQQYRAQRIQQMKDQAKSGKKRKIFGNLTELRGDKFTNAIDSAPPEAFVVIHIYDEFIINCVKLNRCLAELAKIHPTVKFCRIQSHQLDLSKNFLDKGLPAILVYKGGEIVGNLLRVTDTLGDKFTTRDVEEFLYRYII